MPDQLSAFWALFDPRIRFPMAWDGECGKFVLQARASAPNKVERALPKVPAAGSTPNTGSNFHVPPTSIPGTRFEPAWGYCGQRMLVSRWAHNPECRGSIPLPPPSGVAQRQGPWPLTT